MVRLAFIFPGQGSQTVGMGRDLYESFKDSRSYYDEAEEILEFPLKRYSFEGPEETLKQTYITQSALFVHSVVLTKLLANQAITPVITAGHSVGEYSALAAAGALPFSDMLRLVKIRGELMQTAGEKTPGMMAALIGGDNDAVSAICREAGSMGIVKPANYNAPGQVVVSGSKEGVQRAMEIARDRGVRRAVELKVSGAFHSPLMAEATGRLIEEIHLSSWRTTKLPVVANVTAQPMSDPEKIKHNLEEQLLSPVRWSESVVYMAKSGIDAFIEVGAGRVLQGLVKRIRKEIPCYSVGTVGELETIGQALL